MAYIALYRKWRPQTFADLVGQDHISQTLSHAITTGKIGHAYLFAGPRGTGKTSTAKILAKALNCEHGPTPEPCGACEPCKKITDGTSMDVFEIDAASNRGIDEIRDLRETVKFAPAESRYKVYIIDEVHMLTSEAFNALLKTLEEPPEHVVFILATTEAHKVPPTIQSRCQRYDFHRITVEDIEQRLHTIVAQMGMEAEDEALAMIAIQADGGLRDALSILDQCSALAEGKITAERVRQILGLVGHDWIYRMTGAMAGHRPQEILEIVAELLRDGKDLRQILAELSLHFRSIMIYQAAGTLEKMDLYAEQQDVLQDQSQYFTPAQVMAIITRLHEAMNEMKWSPQPRITVEVALLALAHGVDEKAVTAEAMGQGTAQAGVSSAAPAVSAPSGGAAPAADGARIAKLEAQLAKVTELIEKGIPAAKAADSTGAEEQSKKKVSSRNAPPLPAGTVPDPKLVTDEGQQLYQQMIAELKKDPKLRRVAFTIGRAKFAGMTDQIFYIQFNSTMAAIAQNSYSDLIADTLRKLSGKDRLVRCIADNGEMLSGSHGAVTEKKETRAAKAKAEQAKQAAEKKKEQALAQKTMKEELANAPEEKRHAVDAAMSLLNGTVVSMSDDEVPPPDDSDAPPPDDFDAPPPDDEDAPFPEEE